MREVGNLSASVNIIPAHRERPLSIATTHTQAVTTCPKVACAPPFPKVNVSSPTRWRVLIDEVAEIGMATESLTNYEELVSLPFYEWRHALVLPVDHPTGAQGASHGRRGARTPHHLPPVIHRAQRIDTAFAQRKLRTAHCSGSHRPDVIKDPCAHGSGHRHCCRDGGARRGGRWRPEWPGRAPGRQPVWSEHSPRGIQARSPPAQLVYTFAELSATASTASSLPAPWTGHVEDYDY